MSASNSTTAGVNASFAYDGLNRCVSRTVNGVTTYLLYNGWTLLEELDATGAPQTRYVAGVHPDEMLARITPSGSVYYHEDGLGSVARLTDSQSQVLEQYLFTGREYLSALGIYDYRHRYYSCTLGRWLSRDSLGEGAGTNLYVYVLNNPIDSIDPLGLDTQIIVHRNAPLSGQQARDASGTMSVFHNGQFQFSTPVNQYGYQDGSHGIYPGNYNVLPRTDADRQSHFPNGTPAVTAPGESNPGDAGHGYHDVFIHPETNIPGGDSRGCQTVSSSAANQIKADMDADRKLGQPTTLSIYNYGGSPSGTPQ